MDGFTSTALISLLGVVIFCLYHIEKQLEAIHELIANDIRNTTKF